MNERIEELFKRAGGSVSIHNLMSNPMQQREYREIWNENIDKFAELIVKETITEMCQQLYWHGEDQSNNPSFYKAIDKTKKHFGVEE